MKFKMPKGRGRGSFKKVARAFKKGEEISARFDKAGESKRRSQ